MVVCVTTTTDHPEAAVPGAAQAMRGLQRQASRPSRLIGSVWLWPLLAGAWLLGERPLQAEVSAASGAQSLGTVVNGVTGGSCSSGPCTVSGGTEAGTNLFHRMSAFDTRGAITGVQFTNGGQSNVIVGVTSPFGTHIDKLVSLSNPGNLLFLSPGGLSLSGAAGFFQINHLGLTTANTMALGGGGVFDVFNTSASQAAGLTGNPLLGARNLMVDPAVRSAAGIQGVPGIVADGINISVDRELLIDAVDGSVKVQDSTLALRPWQGQGGKLSLLGSEVLVEGASQLLATGSKGGGLIQVGGSWQNSNPEVRQAVRTAFGSRALADASAIDFGNGGTIALWSDVFNPNSLTTAKGSLKAEAGSLGGDGGRLETSGYGLDVAGIQVSTRSLKGLTGVWLLDPSDITITNTTPVIQGVGSNPSVFSTTADSSVSVNTSTKLTLKADRNIVLNANYSQAGLGALELLAGQGAGAGGVRGAGNISLAGGSLVVDVDITTDPLPYTGQISGIGASLIKKGSGTLILSGNSSYSGGTIVESGQLAAGRYYTIPNSNPPVFVSDVGTTSTSFGTGLITVVSGAELNLVGRKLANSLSLSGDGRNLQGILTGALSNSDPSNPNNYNGGFDFADVTGAVTLASQGARVRSPYPMALSGAIGGSGALTVAGSVLTLSGANTYSGGTIIDGVTLVLGSAGAIGSTGDIQFQNDGILEYGPSNTADYSSRLSPLTGQVYWIDVANANQSVAFASAFRGQDASLVKSGPGTLVLASANTFTGSVDVDEGALRVANASALGASSSGTSVALGARLFFDVSGSPQISEPITSVWSPDSIDHARIVCLQSCSFVAPFTLQANLRIDSVDSGAPISVGIGSQSQASAFTAATQSAFELIFSGNQYTQFAVTSPIATAAGGFRVRKFNSAAAGPVVTLSAANTFTGPVNLEAGSLVLSSGGSLSATSPVTVQSPGSFVIQASKVIGSLAGSGSVSVPASSVLSVGANNTSTSFSGVISGGGGVTKLGTGTLTLSGSNTYSGPTLVEGGNLIVEGSDPDVATCAGGSSNICASTTPAPQPTTEGGGGGEDDIAEDDLDSVDEADVAGDIDIADDEADVAGDIDIADDEADVAGDIDIADDEQLADLFDVFDGVFSEEEIREINVILDSLVSEAENTPLIFSKAVEFDGLSALADVFTGGDIDGATDFSSSQAAESAVSDAPDSFEGALALSDAAGETMLSSQGFDVDVSLGSSFSVEAQGAPESAESSTVGSSSEQPSSSSPEPANDSTGSVAGDPGEPSASSESSSAPAITTPGGTAVSNVPPQQAVVGLAQSDQVQSEALVNAVLPEQRGSAITTPSVTQLQSGLSNAAATIRSAGGAGGLGSGARGGTGIGPAGRLGPQSWLPRGLLLGSDSDQLMASAHTLIAASDVSRAAVLPPSFNRAAYNPAILNVRFTQGREKLGSSSNDAFLDITLIPLEGDPEGRRVELSQEVFANDLRTLYRQLSRQESLQVDDPKSPSRRLYDQLFAAITPVLQQRGITTLLISADRGLQAVPFAALHNGERYFGDRYAFSLTPSLALTNLSPPIAAGGRLLAAGASEFDGLAPLPLVPTELTMMSSVAQKDTALNKQFTPSTLLELAADPRYSRVHVATHAEFLPGGPAKSRLYSGTVPVALSDFVKLRLARRNTPLDLISFSACRTALGDAESELGFAGLALQAGARSAVGTLWYVDDVATSAYFVLLYRYLEAGVPKAEALQLARQAFARGLVRVQADSVVGPDGHQLISGLTSTQQRRFEAGFTNPYFWAGIELLGSAW
jgi:autotransporter-associated beta strand protein